MLEFVLFEELIPSLFCSLSSHGALCSTGKKCSTDTANECDEDPAGCSSDSEFHPNEKEKKKK
eukprot:m.231414 g.231414  ORF g.231414 m.231414 type:complete len:63 (+) comp18355_c0_seq1:1426-1614(+)